MTIMRMVTTFFFVVTFTFAFHLFVVQAPIPTGWLFLRLKHAGSTSIRR